MDSDGLGWSWAPDGTQPVVGGEDALRASPAEVAPADAAARRPGDVVIPAVPLGDDPRLAADAVTRWMDDDRARRDSTPPAPPPIPPPGEGAVRPAPWRGGAPHATAAPSPLSTPSPPAAPDHHGAPARDSAATPGQPSASGRTGPSATGWVPVVALMVMLLVIAMVVVLGAA